MGGARRQGFRKDRDSRGEFGEGASTVGTLVVCGWAKKIETQDPQSCGQALQAQR